MEKKDRKVYIDGDVFPYQIGFVCQKVVYFLEVEGQFSGPFLSTKSKRLVNKFLAADPNIIVTELFFVESPIQVIETLKAHIRTIVQGSGCSTFVVCMSGETNFREEVATIQPYKGNREGLDKPYHFNLIREWLLDKPYTVVSDNEEADDLISRAMLEGHVGASPDKDLNNTPGTHFNFRRWEVYEVTPEEASKNFYKQMLTGDTADHIPGIRGIGAVRAGRLIDPCTSEKEMEEVVYEEYKKVYDDPIAAMTEVGQLLWMRREEGEMWEPKL